MTGSVAAYKAAVLLRLLRKEGAELEVVLSRAAQKFVGASTFAGLNDKPPWTDMFEPGANAFGSSRKASRRSALQTPPTPASACE